VNNSIVINFNVGDMALNQQIICFECLVECEISLISKNPSLLYCNSVEIFQLIQKCGRKFNIHTIILPSYFLAF